MKTIARRLSQNTFIRGGVFLSIANFTIGFVNYLFNVFAGRLLGPTGYGEVTTLFASLSILCIPFAAVSMYVIRKVGAQHDKALEYAVTIESYLYHLVRTNVIWIILVICISPFIPYYFNIQWYSAFSLVLLVLLSLVGAVYDGIFMGLQIFVLPAIFALCSVLIKLAGVSGISLGINPVIVVVVIYDLSVIVRIFLGIVLFRKTAGQMRYLAATYHLGMFEILRRKEMIVMTISVAAATILASLDVIVVNEKISGSDAGLYAAWSLISKIIFYSFGPVLSVAYAFFSNKKQRNLHELICLVSMILLLASGAIAYFGYARYGSLLLKTMYGNKFLPLQPYLAWASLYGSGTVMVTFMHNYYLSKNHRAQYLFPSAVCIYALLLVFYTNTISHVMYLSVSTTLVLSMIYAGMFGLQFIKKLMVYNQ